MKKICFVLVAVGVALGVCELVLDLTHFSYVPRDAGFRVTPRYKVFAAEGGNYVTRREQRGTFRYQRFPVHKSPDEVRICVLGGSSINQFEDFPALTMRLENELLGGRKARILNIGGLSYGTERLLLQMQEILEYQPDLILVYAGHNEFEEAFMKRMFFKESCLTRLNDVLVSRLRSYQFLSKLVNFARERSIALLYGGVRPGLPSKVRLAWGTTFDKDEVYGRYRDNVAKMVMLAQSRGVPVILSTVAYNRMVPPFMKSPDDTFDAGLASLEQGDTVAAAGYLERALDADLQPHRASRISNRIISDIAAQYRIPIADVDGRIRSISRSGIPGFDMFTDHCHLNEEGRLIAQGVFFEAIREGGFFRPKERSCHTIQGGKT